MIKFLFVTQDEINTSYLNEVEIRRGKTDLYFIKYLLI